MLHCPNCLELSEKLNGELTLYPSLSPSLSPLQIESLKSQQAETKLQHASELREYAQLLDIKSARIKKLEGQLKDIAYGTRQYKLDTSKFEYEGSSGSALEESIELERGQNLLQFHISQVNVM